MKRYTNGSDYGRVIHCYPEQGGPMGADGTDYVIEDIWPDDRNPLKWIIAFCREREIHYYHAHRGEYQRYNTQTGWRLSTRVTYPAVAIAFFVFAVLIVLAEGGVICHH